LADILRSALEDTRHPLKDAEAILDTHYLGRDVKLAESAIRQLARKKKRTKAVNGLASFASDAR